MIRHCEFVIRHCAFGICDSALAYRLVPGGRVGDINPAKYSFFLILIVAKNATLNMQEL